MHQFAILVYLIKCDVKTETSQLFTPLSTDESYNLDKTAIRKVKLCMCGCGKKIEADKFGDTSLSDYRPYSPGLLT